MAERASADTSLASEAVISSYYNLAVSKGAAARARAAAAQSVSAAIAAGLLALLATRAPEQSTNLKFDAAVASSLWLIASALYLRAIAARVKPKGTELGAQTADEFVRLVLQRARAEEVEIDRRQTVGNIAVLLAIIASVTTVVGAAISAPATKSVLFVPNPEQRQVLVAACGSHLPEAIRGYTHGSLGNSDSFVINVDPKLCNGASITVPAGLYKPDSLAILDDDGGTQ